MGQIKTKNFIMTEIQAENKIKKMEELGKRHGYSEQQIKIYKRVLKEGIPNEKEQLFRALENVGNMGVIRRSDTYY